MTGPPAQLALAILAEVTGDDALAVRLHQEFKRDVIARLAMNRSWQIDSRQVREWLSAAPAGPPHVPGPPGAQAPPLGRHRPAPPRPPRPDHPERDNPERDDPDEPE